MSVIALVSQIREDAVWPQLTGQTVFPVSVETQTAILSVVDEAVSDVLAGSYVDAVSQDKGRGVANVSVVLNLADETTVRHSAHTPSIDPTSKHLAPWPSPETLKVSDLRARPDDP